jgi:hypothetical protein
MSEETKNPLIESFLKLHEYKNPGYGGKGDPYQGRNLQPYMNQKDIPAALKVKETPAAPSPMVSKPTPKPEQPVKAVTPTGSPKMDTEKTSLGNDFKLPSSTSLKPPMGQNAAGSQVGNNSNPAYTPKPAVAQNSSTKGNETNPIRDAADAAYEYGDSAVKKLEQSIAGKKYSKDKFQEFMKWLKSNQNTNEVTEETLNEFAGGTAQDKIPMQQRINNASGSSLRGFSNATNSTNIVRANQSTSALGGFANTVNSTNIVRANQSTSALGGFGNVPNSTNIVRANQSSSTQTYKPDLSTRQNAELGSRALGGFSKVPDSLQTQREKSASALNFPGKGTTGLGATSPEGFIKRMSGIEKANPIAAPGKLAGGNLSLGSRGDAVKELQRKLGVSDDGIFGPKTAEALKKMQQSAGLKADAIYGKQSASYLARKDALSNLRKENPIGAEKMEAGTGNNLQDHSSGILSARSAYERKEAGDISPGWNSLTGRVKSTHSALEDREYANRERENAKREQKFKQGIREESPSMSNKLIDSFMKLQSLNSSNIFEAAKKIKKLDPVGKEDGDLNNDGEENREDDYIKNRREAIKAAMKEGKDPNAELDAPSSGGKAPETSTNPEWLKKMKPQEQTPTSNLKGSLPKGVTVKGNTNEAVVSPMAGQGTSGIGASKGNLPSGVADRLSIQRRDNQRLGEPGSRQRAEHDYVTKKSAEANTPWENTKAFGRAYLSTFKDPILSVVDDIKGFEKPESKTTKTGKNSSTVYKIKEEVEFSEAELAHIAAILEGPVAPTPDDYSGSKNGPSVRNLSDETVSEEEVKRGRGRPKGSKSGSAKGEGQAAGTPHIMDQIKFASARGIADGKGNYMLKHPTSGETRAVPQKAANDAYRDYHGEAKPAGKNAVLSGFLKKHGFSDTSAEKAPEEKRTTAEPKKSVSLPSMPKPKS